MQAFPATLPGRIRRSIRDTQRDLAANPMQPPDLYHVTVFLIDGIYCLDESMLLLILLKERQVPILLQQQFPKNDSDEKRLSARREIRNGVQEGPQDLHPEPFVVG